MEQYKYITEDIRARIEWHTVIGMPVFEVRILAEQVCFLLIMIYLLELKMKRQN